MTTTLKLTFIGSTALARHFRHTNGVCQWVPRSVQGPIAVGNLKVGDVVEVAIQDWWLKDNPFVKKDGQQNQLL